MKTRGRTVGISFGIYVMLGMAIVLGGPVNHTFAQTPRLINRNPIQRQNIERNNPIQRPNARHMPNILAPQSRPFSLTPNQQDAVKITQVEVDIHIIDTIASTTMTIEIENTSNITEQAMLLFPVPNQAVVSDFSYSGPGCDIPIRILPKEEAENIYYSMVAAIRDPALVEFVGYSLIMTRAFPVEPESKRKIVLSYEHILDTDQNRVDYWLPRTESLQYAVPWKITTHIETEQPISTVYSPSHELSIERISDTEVSVIIEVDAYQTPGPFQLSYLLQDDGISGSFFACPDETGEGGYFLLLAGLPASLPTDVEPIKRELTLVIDRSGSMSGVKVEQVKDVTQQIIPALGEDETFNLIIYNSIVQLFSDEPMLRNASAEIAAYNYIEAITANGSTNLYEALKRALEQPPTEGMLPIVLFLTDGLPTTGQTSEIAIRELTISANPHNRRVFTFGVGFDVNAPLLEALAMLSRAKAEFVLPYENVEEKVGKVFQQLKGPVLSDPQLGVFEEDGTTTVGRTQDIMPEVLPDLFEGDKLILMGRYVGNQPLIFEITGNYFGEERTFTFNFDPAIANSNHSFVPRLWASRKVADMIDTIRQMGADPTLDRNDPRIIELTETIVDLSIEFGILTEYTAFLAQEQTPIYNNSSMNTQAGDNLYARGGCDRSGSGAVNQSINMNQQRSQEVLNRDNSYLDENMQYVRVTSVQQINDLTFYHRDEQWVDGRLISDQQEIIPDKIINFGTNEYFELLTQLAACGRHGCLSFADDVLIMVDTEVLLVKMPQEARQFQDIPIISPSSVIQIPSQTYNSSGGTSR